MTYGWAIYSAIHEDHVLSAFVHLGIHPTIPSLHHGSLYVVDTIVKPIPEMRSQP